MTTFFEILQSAAQQIPDKPLFVFPETRWRPEETVTYGTLRDRSAAAAGVLASVVRPGDRALLLFPTGSEFWEAFLGCLAAGVVAVPLHTPNLNRTSEMLAGVCRDCRPALLLTDENTAVLIRKRADRHPYLVDVPVITPDRWRHASAVFAVKTGSDDRTALLQYTSGSTSHPKGVQVSHGNLLANAELIRVRMGIRTRDDCAVTWLPHYHDMGLVGSYLVTLYSQNTTWCLPPEEFVLRPERWLQLISEQRATICGGPDFGYRRCAEKITDEQLEGVDLSSWRVAYIGAEKIRPETLSSFRQRFSRTGFRESAFFPCYGLAEATLMVTGGPVDAAPVIRRVSTAALAAGRINSASTPGDRTELAGCGQTFSGSRVVIRDLETAAALEEERIGEVCVAGPSVTNGYFHRPEQNGDLFCEVMIDGRPERLLRTGDLGFLSAGELFITGRNSGRMIVRGKNLYPEDIEEQACAAHAAVASGGAFAFSTELDGQEELIVAAELERTAMRTESPELVAAAIRQEVNAACGVNPAEILLLRPATLPRTTSGKPRRRALRDLYVAGTIDCLFRERE
ncbi:MAG: fatty acyl-AMP ligase [Planctomycetaceae bacterium]